MNVTINSLDELNKQEWDDYVLNHPQAEHYHLSGWGKVIEQAYRHETLYFGARKSAKLQGILPVVVMQGRRRRKRLVSMPFLDYGGVCVEDSDVASTLYQAVYRAFESSSLSLIDLRHRHPTPLPLTRYGDKVTMILDLDPSAEAMWKKFPGKVRNQVRKAEKEQLQVRWAPPHEVDDFYQVYVHNMRDLGSPPHSLKFFQAILTEFADARLVLVQLGRDVIGGAVCLVCKDKMLVPWASSLRPYFRLCPNNLLYWEAIRTACEEGLRYFDFGRSSRDSGTYKFKKQWGAREEPLYWQSNASGGDGIDESQHRMLGYVVQVWQRLPVGVTRLVGPALRRRISN